MTLTVPAFVVVVVAVAAAVVTWRALDLVLRAYRGY